MSLFLRKACQAHLDGVGLDNYHIQVSDSTKCLQIVGECGDTLVSIAGIRLSRMAPAANEIELAIELFDDFLAKHTGTFKEFIAAKIRADKSAIPPAPEGLLDAKMIKMPYQDFHQLTFSLASCEKEHRITVRSDGYFNIPAFNMNMIENPGVSIQQGLSTAEKRIVTSWVKACKEFNDAIKEKVALLAKLSSCEI